MATRDSATPEGGRIRVVLSCTVCGNRNYRTKKAPREGGPALKLKKFCSSCQHHTVHIEGR